MVTYDPSRARRLNPWWLLAAFALAELVPVAAVAGESGAAAGTAAPRAPAASPDPTAAPAPPASGEPAEPGADGSERPDAQPAEPSSAEPLAGSSKRRHPARKRTPSRAAASLPDLSHTPPATAPADEPLVLHADLTHAADVARALVVFRAPGVKGYRAVEFRRSEQGPYVAIIPARYVVPPSLGYTIELELRSGRRLAIFGRRAEPHLVQVQPDGMDIIEAATAERVEDRRAVFWSGGEYVSFGTSEAEVEVDTPTGTILEKRQVDDRFFRMEGGFTYRLLRTVSEFGIRVGVVRGSAPVPVRDLLPGQDESERFDVGLNYGAPWVRFRLHDDWHIDGSLLVNVTEVGFSAGTGGALHIGDPYGSKLTLGFDAIQEFGARIYSQVDIQAHRRLRLSPIIEVTNMPSADDWGMRLVAEIGVDIGYGSRPAADRAWAAASPTRSESAITIRLRLASRTAAVHRQACPLHQPGSANESKGTGS
jgi:hypothetical protein